MAGAEPSQIPAQDAHGTLNEMLRACVTLVDSQHRLVHTMLSSGMIAERTGVALLAKLDQLDAELADVLLRHG